MYNVFKITESANNFYYLLASHISDPELVIEHFEHYIGNNPDLDIAKYFDFIGWELIDIQKVDNVKPADLMNGSLPVDDHCMNTSEKYKEFIVEKPKPKRQTKPKAEGGEPKPPKKAPKPRGKKASQPVIIDKTKTEVDFN